MCIFDLNYNLALHLIYHIDYYILNLIIRVSDNLYNIKHYYFSKILYVLRIHNIASQSHAYSFCIGEELSNDIHKTIKTLNS